MTTELEVDQVSSVLAHLFILFFSLSPFSTYDCVADAAYTRLMYPYRRIR